MNDKVRSDRMKTGQTLQFRRRNIPNPFSNRAPNPLRCPSPLCNNGSLYPIRLRPLRRPLARKSLLLPLPLAAALPSLCLVPTSRVLASPCLATSNFQSYALGRIDPTRCGVVAGEYYFGAINTGYQAFCANRDSDTFSYFGFERNYAVCLYTWGESACSTDNGFGSEHRTQCAEACELIFEYMVVWKSFAVGRFIWRGGCVFRWRGLCLGWGEK